MTTFHFHQDLAFGPDDSNEIKILRYLQAIEKYPEDKDQFLQQLSMLHLTDGQYDKALNYMQQAIEAATDDERRAEYYHFVSYFYADYLDGDNTVLAISNMEKAVELDPESAERLHVLAQYYIDDKQYKKAIALLAKIIAMPQDKHGETPEYEFFERMEWLYTDDNDYDHAQKIYTKMLKQAENDEERALVYMMISYMDEDAQDEENAIANAKRAVELCPANYPAIKRLGDCYTHFKQHEKALKAYNKLLPLAKNETGKYKNWRLRYYYENVAPLHLEMNNPEKAVACYKKMLPLYDSPKDSYNALEQLSAIHYQQKQYDKAVPYLKKIIKLWPNFYPRAYTSMATYYLFVEKDPENALNYLFMAAKANCASDTFLGNDKEIAGLTNAYMGEIYYKNFHDEDTAISYYEKALTCKLEKVVEGEICDSLYKIYTGRGDDENAAKYKERRSGLKIMLDMFSGDWTPPPPKTLHERLRNPKNKDINLEDLPYHYSKLPDDYSKKTEILKPIQEEFERDLLENPAYKEFFANYTPKSVRQFCENYAAHKNLLVSNWECYIDEPSKEVVWRKYAEKMLELILNKKLFNLQLQWRADQIKIPEIRVTLDFQYWNMTLNHEILQCSFIEPITPEEISVMKQFLADDNFFDSTNSWLCGWQEYDKIMEKDEEGDLPLMPIWYEFYDSMMGTGSLLLLPDERGEKEKSYESIYWEWYRKQPPPTAVPPLPAAPEPLLPQPLFTYDGTKYTEFMEMFENDYLCKLHQGWLEERKKPDETYDEDAVREAIMELADADEPLYMDSSLVWHQAIIRCAQKFKNKKVAEKMDEVYANYLMQRELKLNGPVNLDDDRNTSFSKQRSDEIMARILKGRELNGEPRDLNF